MLAQRFNGEIEFLFVDGGSSDRTLDLVRDLRGDDRVRVLHNPARQTTAALNIGLRHARANLRRPHGRPLGATRRLHRRRCRAPVRETSTGSAGAATRRGRGRVVATVARAPVATRPGRLAQCRSVQAQVELDTAVHGRLAPLLSRGARRLGRGVADQPGLRARGPRVRATGAGSSACPIGGRLHAARQPAGARAPVLPLRLLRGQGPLRRHPVTLRRSLLLPPALVATLVVTALPGRAGRLARRGASRSTARRWRWRGCACARRPALPMSSHSPPSGPRCTWPGVAAS